LAFRPKLWDIPIAIYAICPFFTSVHNNLGAYDGGNAVVNQFHTWISAYIVGRIYFTDLEGLNELAGGFIICGLLYCPLCLYEARMSPQLHQKLFGFMQHAFDQTRRLGGFRPMVFLQHGIALGNWMMSASLVSWWLWSCGVFKRLWNFPSWVWVLALIGTTIACRATAAMLLLAIGMVLLYSVKRFQVKFLLILVMLVPVFYTYARAREIWQGDELVRYVAKFNQDRADSLLYRLHNEDLFIARAWQNPIFGWGGWNLFKARDEQDNDIGVPDQQWILAFGKTGLIGLISFEAALLIPIIVLLRRVPIRYWAHPAAAGASVMAMVVLLHLLDCLENAMVNPMFMMAAGGLSGLATVKITLVNRPAAAQQQAAVSAQRQPMTMGAVSFFPPAGVKA